jgi:signal transduction histidine kinase
MADRSHNESVDTGSSQALETTQGRVAASDRRLLRLAYDLHDGPLQELVLFAEDLRLAAGQIEALVPEADRERVRGRFQDLEARLESLEEALREIAQGGRSASSVAHEPIEESVRAELVALDGSGMAMDFSSEGDFDDLTDSQKIALLRVVQEGLTNVRKHSGASSVVVVLSGTPEAIELTIRDDGRGFDVGALGRDRLGLAGVSERVRMLGGDIEIESSPQKGATVRARVPRWRPPSNDES